MSLIRSVSGDIRPEQLGLTLSHEHLLWTVPEPYRDEDPDLGFDDPDIAIRELELFRRAGGAALVEMSTVEIGRRPADLAAISRAAGVHVIAASGHHKDKFSRTFLAGQSVETIALGIVEDVRVGMDGTDIRAGVIKAATSKDQATPGEREVIRAVGLAHRETGAPVSTHTEAGSFALEQIRLLRQAGVAPERMLIGHLDRGLPQQVYFEIAKSGVYMGFDQIGKGKYWPDAERVRLIVSLVEAGYAERILLSGDMARKSNWASYAGPEALGLAYIPARFRGELRDAGLKAETLETILVENPARFLAFA